MVIKSAELETVCGITSVLPKNELPEFAFAGKSNVGKSSLINALLNRKSLARTSGQPGKTQTINYYNVNKSLYFVDLPGYGYAKVSKEIKAKWGKMIEKYLKTSKVLMRVFLLVDIRHEPGENDKTMFDWVISNGFEPVIIATKMDKLSRSQIQHHLKVIRTALKARPGTIIIPFSSETKQGRDEVWALLNAEIEKSKAIKMSDLAESVSENVGETIPQNVADKANDHTKEKTKGSAKENIIKNTKGSAKENIKDKTKGSTGNNKKSAAKKGEASTKTKATVGKNISDVPKKKTKAEEEALIAALIAEARAKSLEEDNY